MTGIPTVRAWLLGWGRLRQLAGSASMGMRRACVATSTPMKTCTRRSSISTSTVSPEKETAHVIVKGGLGGPFVCCH